jgi:hypothetical protein
VRSTRTRESTSMVFEQATLRTESSAIEEIDPIKWEGYIELARLRRSMSSSPANDPFIAREKGGLDV